MMFLQYPICPKDGRTIRILFYARYSTEEQDASSIPDQYAYCQSFLDGANVTKVAIEKLSDAEISGERVYRPGIDGVRDGIETRQWDLILCEDSSRLFRDPVACGDLIGQAVDHEIRVICINDDVDTNDEEHWEDRLHEAQAHHARSNRFTSKRIKRKHEALWEMGAAIGMVKPGYVRRPSVPATIGRPAQGPFFDEVDRQWSDVIYEAFERTYLGEPLWAVAAWLTKTGMPKSPNGSKSEWTEANVLELIRRTVYRGVETWRKTVSKKHHRTGKRGQKRNDPEKVRTRKMEHLRIVPDWLWHGANDVIRKRTRNKSAKRGLEHPLSGVPRDSRGPLAGIFYCRCGAKMYQDGRGSGGYRCSDAKSDKCWNKATALRSLTHERIGKAVADQLLAMDGVVDALIQLVEQSLRHEFHHKTRRAELKSKEEEHDRALSRIANAIESADTNQPPPEVLVQRAQKRQQQLDEVREQLRDLDEKMGDLEIPSPEVIRARLQQTAERLLDLDQEAGVLLRRMVSNITAIPCRQFKSNKVVLRAKFALNVAQLLPDRVLAALRDKDGQAPFDVALTVPVTVDLFERSSGPKFGLKAHECKKRGLTLVAIGKELGIGKRTAYIAAQYGEAMVAAGITDPYEELLAPPENASRWRDRKPLKNLTLANGEQGKTALPELLPC